MSVLLINRRETSKIERQLRVQHESADPVVDLLTEAAVE